MKILVVDDDPGLRTVVAEALTRAGFSVISAANGATALINADRENPDLIVLDIGLPEMDGLEVCRRIRRRSETPILFLSALDEEVDRILGLELGADDYVTKPFSPRELVARIRSILKRTSSETRRSTLQHGLLILDQTAHSCKLGGKDLHLTATEFALLARLMRQPKRIHSRESLVVTICGEASQLSDRTLDSHLRNLRRKLNEAGHAGSIETVRGVGIRMLEYES